MFEQKTGVCSSGKDPHFCYDPRMTASGLDSCGPGVQPPLQQTVSSNKGTSCTVQATVNPDFTQCTTPELTNG